MSILILFQTLFLRICTVGVRLKMLNFVKFLSYLTVQQGKNQDTKANKKHVFLWLGDRMCSKAVNSQYFNKKVPKSCFFMVLCVKNCLLGLIQLKNTISYDFLMIFILRATAS